MGAHLQAAGGFLTPLRMRGRRSTAGAGARPPGARCSPREVNSARTDRSRRYSLLPTVSTVLHTPDAVEQRIVVAHDV